MDAFRVCMNCVDHYQATPIDEFDPPIPLRYTNWDPHGRPRVSVIRVFGATPTGQKVLMHVHGAFQYTYIEYTGSLLPQDVDVAIKTLQQSIDHALAVSYRKNFYEGTHQYVAHISLVKGVPFYGYHVGYKFYLKIYLLNPLHMTRLADLLQEGAVMERVLQPYESHMQYIAQWMCDYNLYGCGYIDCEKVKFRAPVPSFAELTNLMHQWHDLSIAPGDISDGGRLSKQSHCALEVDVHVKDILNRNSVEERRLHHDFIERLHPISADLKLVQSMAGLWKDETRRRKVRMGLKDLHSSPFPPEVLISMSADPRNTDAGGWIHEEEFRDKVSQVAADEYNHSDKRKISFDTFVEPILHESTVQTALESVADLYPDRLGSLWPAAAGAMEADSRAREDQDRIMVDQSCAVDLLDDSESSLEDEYRLGVGASEQSERAVGGHNGINKPSGSQVSAPVSSAEYEKYGIRPAGDTDHLREDVFEAPPEWPSIKDPGETKVPNIPKKAIPKKARFALTSFTPRKRQKYLVDEEGVLPSVSSSEGLDLEKDSEALAAAGRLTVEEVRYAQRPRDAPDGHLTGEPRAEGASTDSAMSGTSSRQSGLSFPSVKNPNDPATVLRLSQRSDFSPDGSACSTVNALTPPVAMKTPPKSRADTFETPASRTTGGSIRPPELVDFSIKGLQKPGKDHFLQFYIPNPPTVKEVESTMREHGLPDVIYQEAFYSKEKDVPNRARAYGGREFKLQSDTLPYLPEFDPTGTSSATFGRKVPVLIDFEAEKARDSQRRKRCTIAEWVIADTPPPKAEVLSWPDDERRSSLGPCDTLHKAAPREMLSQVDCPTPKNQYGFQFSQKQHSTSVQSETQYMSVMSLEVHVNTRGTLAPNPEHDAVACIFWCIQSDNGEVECNGSEDGVRVGILAVADGQHSAENISQRARYDVEVESTELDVLTRMVDIVRRYDPDILTGYEVHNSSWGYLIERARLKYGLNYCDELSKMRSLSHGRFGKEEDRWGFNHTSTIRVTGRHTINIWRAMRAELNLLSYTMENVVFHLLRRRIPHYSFADLTKWYKNLRDLSKVIEYYRSRVQIDLDILDANELVPRTSEQARLLGVDWFSVISRGSQFKVESLMFRIAKPENFILVSPSRRQVGGQNALECLPLVMEPRSDFYTSPMLVLDFQSLYPSVMIAYNYCYSTFLGRIVKWRGTNKMGFTNYQREPRLIELLEDHVNIAPNGIMYTKPEIRRSLLAKMLSEILETRVMVKSGMKVDQDDKLLQRLLNNRQLALKLIANVTYGYTSASFSGRMPCSEIADSIVQTGRETLEKAIALIHSVERWGAEVVYGDTDSLFVYLEGRTREQAFDIGEEIANTITKMNPRPVKLKFEKVYHPCVLLAKKRYVGFKYENRQQTVPEFDAKGIETVRRDGTPAEQKIEETALKLLFRTADLSQVKAFFQAQCAKIMRGRVSIQDFCFAREVKLGTYSDKGPPPPGALISARKMIEDPRLEPQYGERVPYVVITGGPGARLIDRCVAPDILLNDPYSQLDAEYYISKNIIPPLERIFNLVGAIVRQWYDEMPKYRPIRKVPPRQVINGKEVGRSKRTLESYMQSSNCLVCRERLDSDSSLCTSCAQQSSRSMLALRSRLMNSEQKVAQLAKVCRSCEGLGGHEETRCDSKDCPVFYSRTRQTAALAYDEAVIVPALKMLESAEAGSMDW